MAEFARNYERYAWPGGYERFAIMDDGEILCIPCVNDPSNPVHFQGDADGWKVEAFTNTGNEDTDEDSNFLICAHCGRSIGA